ncbi:MAG: PDZ domain-containing protein [Myxococcota bacterium]
MYRIAFALSLLLLPALATNVAAAPSAVAPPAPPSPPSFSMSFSAGQGRLGAQVSSMTPELRSFFAAPPDVGILVQKVLPGTAAEDAGLLVGDVVVAVDGDDVAQLHDVASALSDRGKGDSVTLNVIRDRKRRTLTATLRAAPSSTWSHSFSGASGFPGGSGFPLVFGGGDDVRQQLEAIERRLEALEARGSAKTKPRKPSRASKRKKKKK